MFSTFQMGAENGEGCFASYVQQSFARQCILNANVSRLVT